MGTSCICNDCTVLDCWLIDYVQLLFFACLFLFCLFLCMHSKATRRPLDHKPRPQGLYAITRTLQYLQYP